MNPKSSIFDLIAYLVRRREGGALNYVLRSVIGNEGKLPKIDPIITGWIMREVNALHRFIQTFDLKPSSLYQFLFNCALIFSIEKRWQEEFLKECWIKSRLMEEDDESEDDESEDDERDNVIDWTIFAVGILLGKLEYVVSVAATDYESLIERSLEAASEMDRIRDTKKYSEYTLRILKRQYGSVMVRDIAGEFGLFII